MRKPFITWSILLIISSRRWDEKEVINERCLELAIILEMGEKYAKQISRELPIEEKHGINTPLLNNPNFASTVFHPSKLIYYSALSSGAAKSTSMSSSPTSGSGGTKVL